MSISMLASARDASLAVCISNPLDCIIIIIFLKSGHKTLYKDWLDFVLKFLMDKVSDHLVI